MKKALLLTGLLLVLAVPAMAQTPGLNIAWGTECWGLAAVQNNLMTFACGSNTSPANWRVTGSFVLGADADVGAIDTYFEAVFEGGSIPSWWLRSASADCNYGTGTNYSHVGTYLGPGGCNDIFGGAGTGGGGYGYLVPGIQVQAEGIWANATYTTIPAGLETFADMLVIKNAKTVGTGSCAGCALGAVWGIHHIIVTTPTGDITVPTDQAFAGNQCLVWQHGFTGQPCNAPVPTRNTTWGQVKSLYR